MAKSSVKDECSKVTDKPTASSFSQSTNLQGKTRRSSKRKPSRCIKPVWRKKKQIAQHIPDKNNQELHENPTLCDITTSSSQDQMSNDLNVPVEVSTLNRTKAPASSPVKSSDEISNLTGSQISNLTTYSLQEETIDQQGCQFTDKTFIQQQVWLLSTPFTLQDCPELVNSQGNRNLRKTHIPHDVIQDALRKLNHKIHDEIQKHLNRQCQRKVLGNLLEVEKKILENDRQDDQGNVHVKETMNISEILKICPKEWSLDEGDVDSSLRRKYANIVTELKEIDTELKNANKEIIAYKLWMHRWRDKVSNSHLISEVEYLAKIYSQNSLKKEMARTSEGVNKVVDVLRLQRNIDK